jgi:Holliday junction resolvasome RuvABC ATP-dependent DNA helicase subunit
MFIIKIIFMSSSNYTELQNERVYIDGALRLLAHFEEKLYKLLEEHPLDILLHVSLALTSSAIELLTHLMNLIEGDHQKR